MNKIRVRVREESGREIEIEADKRIVDEFLQKFGFSRESHKTNVVEKSTEITKTLKQASVGGKMSAAEFVLQYQLKKHTDIVLGFGYYLEKHKGLGRFTPGDINNAYYEARLEPSNTSQMIIHNTKRGFLMEDKAGAKTGGGKRVYTLTQTGMRYVENGFKKVK